MRPARVRGAEWFDASGTPSVRIMRKEDEMNTTSRPRASFGTTKKNVPGVLSRAHAMSNAMTENAATFALPTISMGTFGALITALSVAQQSATGTRAKGSATLRNTKRDAVWTAMDSLQSYVQGLADALSAEGAASLIEAAGMLVARTPTHQKAALTATLTTTPGSVHLDANRSLLVGPEGASKKTMLNWEMSADGGKTWTGLPSTPYTTTDVAGLTLLSTYGFRVSVTVGTTPGAWSQTVSVQVH
jgi:hypothetical protein